MMTIEEKMKAVEGVMALRPASSKLSRENKNPETMKRMSDLEFQREMNAIMNDEAPKASAYFFRNSEPQKGGSKNSSFNSYAGADKR
ncbi:hypothetical protein SBW85_03045 [Vibrio plantisponsor]|uniref:Uncharacterized protein n=1 Tax=Vibrio plantisponsor TaxID=664643 RepID=A0ABU4IF19_9VIBR|nr:hypothetical protein [Vibrio plantisponsor]MDW6016744.1 hypothetical protein [Vibrio plantisponsor]NNM39885.1 hypothetical protein [Vibrio plantisponsor]